MRFWFEHSAEVSLREQVVTQVRLGILCGELEPGERLPSIRELARRFSIHPNTVSAGYQELVETGWAESRRGSGVYARAHRAFAEDGSPAAKHALLDRLIAQMLRGTRRLGLSDDEVAARVAWVAGLAAGGQKKATRMLLVEPDPELRAIVLAELRGMAGVAVEGCGLGECGDRLQNALVVALPSKVLAAEAEMRAAGSERRVLRLPVRSVPESLAARLPQRTELRESGLVAVCSGWPTFVQFARTMLIAAGFEADALLVRDTREQGWQDGLEQTAAIVCDVATAAVLPDRKLVVFPILAEDAGALLRRELAVDG